MTIEEYLSRLLAHSGVDDAQITTEETDDEIAVQVNVGEDEVGILIGYHGETIASLQRMIRLVFKDEIEKRIVLNINDYRQSRKEKLQEMVKNIAQRVLETGDEYVFPYLPANERFLVHTELSENPEYAELESVSDGEGLGRRLVIRQK